MHKMTTNKADGEAQSDEILETTIFQVAEGKSTGTGPCEKDSRRGWLICLGFHIAVLLNFGTSRTLGIFLGDWQDEYGVENSTASWVPSGCFSMMGIACLLTTLLHGRIPPRTICVVGGVLGGVSFVVASRANSIAMLTACCIVGFIGCTASYITAFVTLGSWMDKYRPLAFALANTGSPLAGIAFPVLFRILAKEFGWRGCFLLIGAFFFHHCVAGMLMKPFLTLKETVKKSDLPSSTSPNALPSFKSRLPHILTDPRYLIILPYMLCHFGALITGIVYHPSWAKLNGIDDNSVSILVLILGASDLFIRLISGPLLTIPVVRRRILLILIGNELLTVIGAFVLPFTTTFEQIAGASVIYGMAYGNWFTVYFTFLADFYGTENLSKAIGYSLFVGGCSTLILPPTLGKIKEHFEHFELVFYLAGSVAFFAFIILIILYLYDNRKRNT